jgi:hypothetical protein
MLRSFDSRHHRLAGVAKVERLIRANVGKSQSAGGLAPRRGIPSRALYAQISGAAITPT